MPAEWLMTNVSIDSTSLPACSSSGTRSAIDLFFGFRLSRTPTSPNWKEPSTRTTFLPSSVAAATAMLTATVVRPTPPLGLKTATTWPGSAAGVRPPGSARPAGRRRRCGDRHPALLLALAGVDLADRGGELVAAERLDEELARAGEHRAAEVVGLALDRHHHDGGGRDGPGQLLGGGDAVHVRHVDVHQDDVGRQRAGQADRLAAGRRGADHVDVALEAKQLREVVARLRDVVDDQDADLVGHQVGLAFVPAGGHVVDGGGWAPLTATGAGPGRSNAPVAPGSWRSGGERRTARLG